MNQLVSVIVPIYNVEEYIKKCVNSIISQSYKNLEIILVNDGSPDKCPEICDEYAKLDERIKVIHKKNGGLSDARNAGIKESTGDYLTFVDSDDFIETNYVEVLLNNLIEYNADISCGKHNVVYPHKTIKEYTNHFYVLSPKEALDLMLYHEDMDVSVWAKMYKRELFDGIQYPVGRLFEDAATTYRLIDRSTIIVLDSIPIYNYVIREKSITNESFSSRKLDLISSTKEMTDYIRNKYPDLSAGCDRRMVFSYLSTLTQTIKDSSVDKKIRNELLSFIRKNGVTVLRNPRTPKRDVLGILTAMLGYDCFKMCWLTYQFFRGVQTNV